ncbi:MAG: hypothetical protein KGD65_02845 [Candidatus Lokiarchaeota archaeon]|nr:hypothetical protein [Candidatus Lokiarchaeota archaeon]
MENIENLEIAANKNLDIAESEKILAKEFKLAIKLEQKRAKARETLVKNEIELAQIRERLAEKSNHLVKNKETVKDILKFSENNLKIEKDYAIYNEKVAETQRNIAEVQRKIAHLERDIAGDEFKITNEKLNVAKERETLGKKQIAYIKLVKNNAPEEKITKAEKTYIEQQEKLYETMKSVVKKSTSIRRKEDGLADLKKALSEKLAEREKVRPPAV